MAAVKAAGIPSDKVRSLKITREVRGETAEGEDSLSLNIFRYDNSVARGYN